MTEQPSAERPIQAKRDDDWWEALWRQDRLDSAGWGLSFIWAALVLLAEISGYAANHGGWDGWAVFFTGAGVIAIVEALVRLRLPAYRRKWGATMIWGLGLLAVGMGIGGWQGLGWFWVAVFAVSGVAILRGAFAGRH